MMSIRLLFAISLAACSNAGTAPPASTDSGAGADTTDAGASVVGCDLPTNPGVMPHECVLYAGLSSHDEAEIRTKCVSPGKIVVSCPPDGIVGLCVLVPPALGQDFFDKGFDFKLTDGRGTETQYRYETTFGDSECLAAGGKWTPK